MLSCYSLFICINDNQFFKSHQDKLTDMGVQEQWWI